MLYDQGQLASVFAAAYRLTGRAEYRRVVEELADFVLREMTDPAGGFYTALDAETNAQEGAYYTWTADELAQVLPENQRRLLSEVYGLDGEGDFEERQILLLARPLAELAAARKLSEPELAAQLLPPRQALLAARQLRPRPLTDTKVLAGLNGLMIRGLADAGRQLSHPRYAAAAARAADFVLTKMRTPQGRLLRTYAGGQAKQEAFLEDYAYLVDGLIALHQAQGDRRWLVAAAELTDRQLELFWDPRGGGCYFTSGDHQQLIARSKSPVDAAVPSANSLAAANLVYLSRALQRPEYLDRAEKTIAAFAGLLKDSPAAVPRLATSLAELFAARTPPQPNRRSE
jgi:hypothetical protein